MMKCDCLDCCEALLKVAVLFSALYGGWLGHVLVYENFGC